MSNAILPFGVRENVSSSRPMGIAVIGCGYWGMNYVRIFNELTESRVVAVCEQCPERLKEVARRFPNVYLTTQIEDVISQPDVQAVIVCTEATSHFNVTRRLLLAGKHVLVEKPLTTTSSHAQELIELADSQSATLMVGHTFIFNAGVRKVKEYVQQDSGRVYYLYARRTNLGPIRRDVNALWDLAPHDIAIFNYLLNSTPGWVSAIGGKVLGNCRDDVGFISLGYPNNVLAHVHVSWADPDKAREVVVVKSDRRIVFNDLNGVEQVRVFEKGVSPVEEEPLNYGELRFQIRDGDIVSPRVEPAEPLKNQCRHFLECVRTGKSPLSNGTDGRDVVRVLEAMNRSIELKGLQVLVEDQADYVHANVDEPKAPECSVR
ncbi:MAG: oxidoreductase [Acidobacteria bacterium]|nr:MAG: oxidoreductase [Acidobacteriota bacterium]